MVVDERQGARLLTQRDLRPFLFAARHGRGELVVMQILALASVMGELDRLRVEQHDHVV